MSGLRTVEIIGGGLAGLALGLGLRRVGVPVTVTEAGHYPRHRVCGEFITGLDAETIAKLGLGDAMKDALPTRDVRFCFRGGSFFEGKLPKEALRLSRYDLDVRLANSFSEGGGRLLTGQRVTTSGEPEGHVICTGRKHTASPWLGLKCHASGMDVSGGLEMHLGKGGYVGLCAVGGGRVNICGLFRRRPVSGKRWSLLLSYLRAAGLSELSERLQDATWDERSFCGISGFSLRGYPGVGRCIQIGDAQGMIAPFTGQGMATAFRSAALAVAPLAEWAHGSIPWTIARREIGRALQHAFRRRFRVALWLHPFMHTTLGQLCFLRAQKAGAFGREGCCRLIH